MTLPQSSVCDLGRWWNCRRVRKPLAGTVSWVTTETVPILCILSLTCPFCNLLTCEWFSFLFLIFFPQNIISVMQKNSFKHFSAVIINPGCYYEKHILTKTEAVEHSHCVMAQGLNFYVELWMEGLSFDESDKNPTYFRQWKNARQLESCTFGKSLSFWCWFWKGLCMPLWVIRWTNWWGYQWRWAAILWEALPTNLSLVCFPKKIRFMQLLHLPAHPLPSLYHLPSSWPADSEVSA